MRELDQDSTPLENYLHHLFPNEPTELFFEARSIAHSLGKAAISLSPSEGRMVSTLVSSHQCKKFVEIGTLTGVSALWIAQGLDAGGELWTLEKDPKHSQLAQGIFDQWSLKENSDRKIHLVTGDAKETLNSIKPQGPFDGILIDGNKSAYGAYLDWAESNLKKGALILADNIFLGGAVLTGNKAQFSKKQITVMKEFNLRLADPTRYRSTVLPTGEGLFMALKLF
jgi:predicted O-methyltransferase YrrM